jgi:hypothetical protein
MEKKEASYIDYLLGGVGEKQLLNEDNHEYGQNEFRVFKHHPLKSVNADTQVAEHTDELGYVRVNPYADHEVEIAVYDKNKGSYARVIVPKELFDEFKKFAIERLNKV